MKAHHRHTQHFGLIACLWVALLGLSGVAVAGVGPALLAAVPPPQPDFVITDIVLPTSTPVVDIPFDVQITVTNQGTASGHGGGLYV